MIWPQGTAGGLREVSDLVGPSAPTVQGPSEAASLLSADFQAWSFSPYLQLRFAQMRMQLLNDNVQLLNDNVHVRAVENCIKLKVLCVYILFDGSVPERNTMPIK